MEIIIILIFLILFIFGIFGKYSNLKIILLNTLFIIGFIIIGIFSLDILIGNQFFIYNLFGVNLFKIGNLESYFLFVFSILGISIGFYNNFYFKKYFEHGKLLNFYYGFMLLFIISMIGVIISNEMITFLIFWEIMSVSSYFLVVHEYEKENVLKSGSWYFILTHIGMFFIVFGMLPIIQITGNTDFLTWNNINIDNSLKYVCFLGLLIGFGSKAGLFPFHIWLPKAHPIAPSNISALMSGFMVKIPILMLIKMIFILKSNINIYDGIGVMILGSIGAFIGIFYGISETNTKKLLAYSTIENIGLIFTSLGVALIGISVSNSILMIVGFFGVFYHIFNHSIVKTLLFLIAGSLIERTNIHDFSKMGGIIKFIPFIGYIALFGCMAMSGFAPLNLFNSEILVFSGIISLLKLDYGIFFKIIFIFSLLLISLMSIMSLITFSKFFGISFLGLKRTQFEINQINNKSENISYLILGTLIFLLSIFPGFIYYFCLKFLGISNFQVNIFELSIDNLLFLNSSYKPIVFWIIFLLIFFIVLLIYKYITRNAKKIQIWKCGYPELILKSQYEAQSLIQPIRRIYRNIYLEIVNKIYENKIEGKTYYKRHLKNINYSYKNKDMILFIYELFMNFVLIISSNVKKIQNGQLSWYIGYILIILLIVLIFNFLKF